MERGLPVPVVCEPVVTMVHELRVDRLANVRCPAAVGCPAPISCRAAVAAAVETEELSTASGC